LENKYSVPQFTSLEWKPLNTIEISNQDDAKSLLILLEKLEELDDVQNVFANFNINETLMEKLI
jgi:transcriptional/translational regulatory protein YebC/TACO1